VAALDLRTTGLGAATAFAVAFLTGLAAVRFATGAGVAETTGFAAITAAATTGVASATGAATVFATCAEFTLGVTTATLSTFFAFSAGTLATIGLHHCYVAVHNIGGLVKFQAFFVHRTKIIYCALLQCPIR